MYITVSQVDFIELRLYIDDLFHHGFPKILRNVCRKSSHRDSIHIFNQYQSHRAGPLAGMADFRGVRAIVFRNTFPLSVMKILVCSTFPGVFKINVKEGIRIIRMVVI